MAMLPEVLYVVYATAHLQRIPVSVFEFSVVVMQLILIVKLKMSHQVGATYPDVLFACLRRILKGGLETNQHFRRIV